jgi:hypothetical protein
MKVVVEAEELELLVAVSQTIHNSMRHKTLLGCVTLKTAVTEPVFWASWKPWLLSPEKAKVVVPGAFIAWGS